MGEPQKFYDEKKKPDAQTTYCMILFILMFRIGKSSEIDSLRLKMETGLTKWVQGR